MSKFHWFYLFFNLHQILFGNFVFSSCIDYCQFNCEETVNDEPTIIKNSACNCKPPAPNCVELIENHDEFRTWMVDLHNELRHKFALGLDARWPHTVANMHTISYDFDLEHTARCHLGQCIFEHDKCRRTPNFESAGQNLMAASWRLSEEAETKLLVKSWYEELNYMKFDGEHATIFDQLEDRYFDQRPDNKAVGHATQFLWAKSTHIGCVQFLDLNQNQTYIYYLGCNYGPSGNVIGDATFLRGEPCSECDKNEKCNNKEYPGLCGNVVHTKKSNSAKHFISKLLIFFLLLLVVNYIY